MFKTINLTLAMALVAVLCSLSLAAPVADSIQINGLNGAKIYVLVTQDVSDSLAHNGNPIAALLVSKALTAKEKNRVDSLLAAAADQKAIDDSIAAVQQAIADSLAEVEEKKNFWPNVQKAREEIPEDFDSLLYWADTSFKVAAVLLSYDVPKDWIDNNISLINDGFSEDVITAAALNYAQTRNMLHRYAVELNGPAHRRLMGQDSVLSADVSSKADQACLEETNASLVQTREAVELTFEMATINTGNIQVLATELDGLKRSVWTCLEGLRRTKIRKSQSDDNRRMIDALTAQSTTAVEPIKVKSSQL